MSSYTIVCHQTILNTQLDIMYVCMCVCECLTLRTGLCSTRPTDSLNTRRVLLGPSIDCRGEGRQNLPTPPSGLGVRDGLQCAGSISIVIVEGVRERMGGGEGNGTGNLDPSDGSVPLARLGRGGDFVGSGLGGLPRDLRR